MTEQPLNRYQWLGKDALHLDELAICQSGRQVIGCYGGNTEAGANKNEDAALTWSVSGADGWEFAVLVDAHFSAQSAVLLLETFEAERESIVSCLSQPVEKAFAGLQAHLLYVFGSEAFRASARRCIGEASCLICARKDRYLWWMRIGDCVLYMLHPDLARLGQVALTQRSFYEWIGERNVFDLPVACYGTGVRELLHGRNRIVMTTDGLLEYGGRPFEDHLYLYEFFKRDDLMLVIEEALEQVHEGLGQDSATIIAWDAAG